jgi:hypothetical protein
VQAADFRAFGGDVRSVVEHVIDKMVALATLRYGKTPCLDASGRSLPTTTIASLRVFLPPIETLYCLCFDLDSICNVNHKSIGAERSPVRP